MARGLAALAEGKRSHSWRQRLTDEETTRRPDHPDPVCGLCAAGPTACADNARPVALTDPLTDAFTNAFADTRAKKTDDLSIR